MPDGEDWGARNEGRNGWRYYTEGRKFVQDEEVAFQRLSNAFVAIIVHPNKHNVPRFAAK